MNGKKWKTRGKTEILDEDFLNALSIEIEKKYPTNTKRKEQKIEILDVEPIEKNETSKLIEESIEFLIADEKENKKTKKKDETIEVLNDKLEKITKTSKNMEESIEILKTESPKKSKKEIEILSDNLETLSKVSKKIEKSIEILSVDTPEYDKKEHIEILGEKIEKLSKVSKKIEDSIEVLMDYPQRKRTETIEILNDQAETLKETSKNLENTIELLKIEWPVEKRENIEILNDQLDDLSSPDNLENTIQFFKIKAEEEIEMLEEEIQDYKEPSSNLENTIELLDILKPTTPIQVKNKIKPKKKPWIILLSICILILLGLAYKAFFWQKDSIETNRKIEKIVKTTETKESIIKKENIPGATVKEDERYFNYLEVDFEKLIEENVEVQGWIKLNNTNINYPFVQTGDNEYYLKHSFDRSYNTAGWVFADFRNNFDTFDQNTILYAHGRLDNTMFGSLKKVVEKSWYEEEENKFLQMSTPKSNTIWQVFSVYTIEPEIYYITPNFSDKEEYQTFLDTLTKRSVYDFKVNLNTDDKILTLSSCYNDTLRVVLHAKLVNISKS